MRHKLKIEFLERSGIGSYDIASLPMDASLRSYSRISCSDKSLILMDCPPEYTTITSFVKVAQLLNSHQLRSPQIFNMDHENGFILMEDFGDVTIKKFIVNNPESIPEVYRNIIELLVDIQKIEVQTLDDHSLDILLSGIETYIDWYLNIENKERELYLEYWRKSLSSLPDLGKVVILRDFHVENLMSLGNLPKNIGLLDFQDAMLGHRAYDLVSLLQDARYDVPDDLEAEMIDYYLSFYPKMDRANFLYSYHLLGAQRNSRILGVFKRKAVRDNNKKYLDFIPLVKRYLDKDLKQLGFKNGSIIARICQAEGYDFQEIKV